MKRALPTFVLGVSIFLSWTLASGGDKKLAPDKKVSSTDLAWTVDDVILAEEAGGLEIAPDGKQVVWLKRAPDKEKNEMIAYLMRSSLTDSSEVQLTRGQHSSHQPQWSPDGKRVAFLSARPVPKGSKRDGDDDKDDDKTQVWLINPFGGEPWAITDSPRDIRTFAWRDNDTILFVAQEKKTKRESDLKEKKDTSQVIDDEPNEPPVRLWKVDIKEKKSERLTDNTDRIQSLAVSPDGRWAVTIHERSLSYTFDHRIKPAVFLCDLAKNERKRVFGDTFNITKVYWQHDSKGFYAVNQFTRHPRYLMAYVEELHHYDLADQKGSRVELDWPRGLADSAEGFAVTSDGFIALLANGVRHSARRYVEEAGAWKSHTLDLKNVQELRVSKDGKTIVYMQSSAISPPRWFRATLDGNALQKPNELADVNAELRKKPMAKTELFRWKGALNDEIEGLVSYPHDYQEGKKYPLIVLIHGGPHWADFDHWDERWAYVRNLLCARGAVVLRPNYHGSSHYGLAFAESIEARYYLPVEDVEKGIDALTARGFVDANKVGLGGWSNGAILTMSLITRRNYQAASAGAGGSEWSSDWGVCDFGMCFSNYYIGKSPLEDPELYRKNAPFYDFHKVKTPTILFHGSEDKDVPTHHSWYQFRALRELGKADVRFLLFPGEKHGLKKLTHRRRKVEEELAWFDKHLFKSTKPINLALKEDSPLGVALSLKKAAKSGQLYGEMKDGILVPEVVVFKNLPIGRFEVTRAQFACFDKMYTFEPGTENHPASGVSFEQAKAYCAWLANKTGRPFRLGAVKEMAEIYDSSEGTENTLDHWAGYAINPEDRVKLQAAIQDLGGKAPLLKEVGSFKSADAKVAVFDLNGNVAEWADDNGKGKALGGSADVPAGERGQRAPAPDYIGFRVVSKK
jgi:dipeptidyl aminopeptidase/acylaminoacyl peptidase